MTKQELKIKNENLFLRNTMLLNENQKLRNKITALLNGNYIAELEKENAELKERYNKVDIIGYDALKNLTKAKEHIKQLLGCLKQDTNDPETNYYVCQYMDKAEQFLREIDIDNAIQKANEGLDLDKIADEVEQDLNENCPDVLCKDCNKEDCIARKLGLIC